MGKLETADGPVTYGNKGDEEKRYLHTFTDGVRFLVPSEPRKCLKLRVLRCLLLKQLPDQD